MTQTKKQAADVRRKYQKEELLRADRLRPYRDVAEAVLMSEREYTLQEAEDMVRNFLKGKVE